MTETFFHFQNPLYLTLLFLLPPLFIWERKREKRATFFYSSLRLIGPLPHSLRQKMTFLPSLVFLISLFFLILALARPQLGTKTVETLTEGIDILLTIDTSGSMKALDFTLNGKEANRLDVVKQVVDRFVGQRSSDRIGMVVFGEEAFTQCPLTHDISTLRLFLQWIRIGVVGDGTAIGNALAVGVKRLKNQKTKSKIIILLTDGRNNAGSVAPLTAAQIAKESNIKVYTIGVGSEGLVPYPESTPLGTRKVYARLDLDEGTLKKIAEVTGGLYFRATETEELTKIYEKIDELEKTEIKVKEYYDNDELYTGFVLAGIFLLVASVVLSRTLFLRIP